MLALAKAPAKPKQDQLLFDWRLPAGDFVTLKQIANACGWSLDSVERAFDEGRLLGNCTTMSAKHSAEKRRSFRIPRETAALFLAEIANYGAAESLDLVERFIAKWPRALQHELLQRLSR